MIRKFLCFLFFILFTNLTFGQANRDYYQLFQNSFFGVSYPGELAKNCIPTVCLLRIEADPEMKNFTLDISDSADSLFIKQVKKYTRNIQFEYLRSYLLFNFKSVNALVFYIPLNYMIKSYEFPCTTEKISLEKMTAYYKFGGKMISGPAVFLSPIVQHSVARR